MSDFALPTRKTPRLTGSASRPGRHAAPSPAINSGLPFDTARCACGGGCPRCTGEHSAAPSLPISRAGDPGEREAHLLAAQAMSPGRHRSPSRIAETGSGVQRSAAGEAPTAATAPALSGATGEPLAPPLRAWAESHLGADFSGVRIHRDAAAASSAAALGARAFTLGSDVVFGAGQYRPETAAGRRLVAHELVHVVQQSTGGARIQREEAGQQQAAAQPAVAGTVEDMVFFLLNPGLETDAGLANALRLLGRYAPQVTVDRVRFEILPEAERESGLGHGLREGGDSIWEGDVPVIRLPQSAYDTVSRHMARQADVADVHTVVRTIGHEMHHLWRARQGHVGNPVQPVYQAEATRRMEQVRQNWLEWIQSNPQARREAGLPRAARVERWEDIPQAERQRIETGAAQTDYIRGMYQRSAYLVEEILTKVEELQFLRVQQHTEAQEARTPSRMEVSELARLIHLLWNLFMNGGDELLTPTLRQQTLDAMLAYLRRRYPNRADSSLDSFEVVYFLCAINFGMPPLYSGGVLISNPPPGARVAPRAQP